MEAPSKTSNNKQEYSLIQSVVPSRGASNFQNACYHIRHSEAWYNQQKNTKNRPKTPIETTNNKLVCFLISLWYLFNLKLTLMWIFSYKYCCYRASEPCHFAVVCGFLKKWTNWSTFSKTAKIEPKKSSWIYIYIDTQLFS
jgi:hypothetical protein